MPRLDLSKAHCQGLVLSGDVALPEHAIETLRKAVIGAGQDVEWPWLFSETYRSSGKDHFVQGFFGPSENGSDFSFQIAYSGEPDDAFPQAAAVSVLVDVLNSVGLAVDISCTASFAYAEADGTSVVKLPIPMGAGLPLAKQVEIRGLRFALMGDEDALETIVIVDRPVNETYSHQLFFRRLGAISLQLPAEVFARATAVSASLFTVAESDKGSEESEQ